MINAELDLEKLNLEFQKNKRICIPGFLETDFADLLYSSFFEITSKNLWYQVNNGNPKYYDKDLTGLVSISKHFSYKYEKYPVKNISLQSLISNDSRRTDLKNLQPITATPEFELPAQHPFRQIGDLIVSKQMSEAIKAITGFDASINIPAAFASRYTAGDFNSAHDDSNHFSAVAFVLNMTKHWLPFWGGNLVLYDEEYDNIIEAYTPKFNSMIIFDVPVPHAVLPVSNYCQSERIAISGWFHNLKKGSPKKE